MVICVLFHLTILYKTSYKRFTVRGTIRAEPEYLGLEGGGTSGFGRTLCRCERATFVSRASIFPTSRSGV